ncbi:MAG TPA: rod shape-determining protein RodA [Chloroflexus aurantiacus]|uniref:Cell cycle protein n=1 Tax=Chloroflexus aurantiacus (strain ATCC 29366 / DSM 635 / J-10-fl) TaxID=324602 RepID=A9WFK0_CHLAA|nr:FtsW/RodA/SpoVE family cell cycle protein [Chloroflexus aurantiacus]ABY33938.1 cell cycle protein [Chloroflexus aurantiacus J-10-fl]HBW65806.1 rod shape-determining protein RodA [Chloroflexus aurantiacus]
METRRWRDLDWGILVSVAVLLIIGSLALHSATLNAVAGNGLPLRPVFGRQIVYIVVGLIAMVAMMSFDYRLLSSLARPLYVSTILLLGAVLVIGRVSEGAQSWIAIGERTFQPAELGKLVLIIALATYWQHYADRGGSWLVQIGGLLIAGVPMALIFIQPDLGTTLVLAGIWLTMAWGGGMRLVQLITLFIAAIPLAWIAWHYVLDTYQQVRLSTFYYLLTNPAAVDFNAAYNVIQALNAISSGGLTGTGLTRGLFSQGNYVPVQHTDFIFAVIGEELGFIGGVVLIIFQAVVLWQTLSIAGKARDQFGRLIALGIFGMLFSHTVINIGMNMSLLPVTGLPLPFVSAGGSFMVTTLIAIGLLQSISLRHRHIAF